MTPTNHPGTQRRRRWRAAILSTALVVIGAGAVFYVRAADMHSGGWHHCAMMEGGFEQHQEHLQAMLTRIGASDAQKAQIEGLMKPAFDDMKSVHEAHASTFAQFHETLLAPSVDRARLEALRVEQMRALDEVSKRFVTALSDAAEVLSPDQRAALAREMQNHHGG